MASPEQEQKTHAIFALSREVASNENRLWEIVQNEKFGADPAKEAVILKIDAYFAGLQADRLSAKPGEKAQPVPAVSDMAIWKDPEVEAFFAERTKGKSEQLQRTFKAPFEKYAKQSALVLSSVDKLDMLVGNNDLSQTLVAKVDADYDDKDPTAQHGKYFNADMAALRALPPEVRESLAPELLQKIAIARVEELGKKSAGNHSDGRISNEEATRFIKLIQNSAKTLDTFEALENPTEAQVKAANEARALLASVDLGDGAFGASDLAPIEKALSANSRGELNKLRASLGDKNYPVSTVGNAAAQSLPASTSAKTQLAP